MTQRKTNFKIMLLGEAGSGKTNFVRSLLGELPMNTYTPTLGVDVRGLKFSTEHGTFQVNLWEVGGSQRFQGLGVDAYSVEADACVIMAGKSDIKTFVDDFHRVSKGPIYVWGKNTTTKQGHMFFSDLLAHLTELVFEKPIKISKGKVDPSLKKASHVPKPHEVPHE